MVILYMVYDMVSIASLLYGMSKSYTINGSTSIFNNGETRGDKSVYNPCKAWSPGKSAPTAVAIYRRCLPLSRRRALDTSSRHRQLDSVESRRIDAILAIASPIYVQLRLTA
jgi:hypothetical protein